jgi:hypothetical protein
MFRISQRVECICAEFVTAPCVIQPTLKAEYTIRGIRTHDDAGTYLLLRELVNEPCSCWGCTQETAFSALGFRPLVSDEVKNEYVTRMIDKAKREFNQPTRRKTVRAWLYEILSLPNPR